MKTDEKKNPKGTVSPELVARAREGDQAAFGELYALTNPLLYRSVRSMVQNEDLIWDILQDTYLRAFRSMDRLDSNDAFLPWLRRIAVNEAARQTAKRLPVTFTDLAADDGRDYWEPVIPDPSIGNQPELALDRRETARLVREILSGLPEQQQLIVGMRYYEDMSVNEIAELLNLSPGTVKAQLFRGRRYVETRVRELEQQGVKLYGMGPIPFLVALLRGLDPARSAEQKALAAVLAHAPTGGCVTAGAAAAGRAAATGGTAAAVGETAVNMTVMTAGQAFLHGLAVKILSGVLAVALIGGGLWAGSRLLSGRTVYGDYRPTETHLIPVTENQAQSDSTEPGTESTGPEESESAPETTAPARRPAAFSSMPNTATSTEAAPAPSTQPPTAPSAEAPTDSSDVGSGANVSTGLLPQPTPTDISVGPGDVTTTPYPAGSIYVSNGSGYSAYYFTEANSTRFCEAVNGLAQALAGKAEVYSLICPTSTGVMLSEEVRSTLGFSDQNQALAWLYAHMDPQVKPVPVYGSLKRHNDENIYFHTDHHWTALGAYYAYREFCAQKGIQPHALTDFVSFSYSDFQGTFINYSDQNEELLAAYDTLTAYVPNGTNRMTVQVPQGQGYAVKDWHIVNDEANYSNGSYYLVFLGGDQPYSYAHNETVTDGSSVLVVKDSYGNDFVPFLIDHYEHIYWIDYHSYADWCAAQGEPDPSVSGLVERNGIQDVILCNIINSTGSNTYLSDIEPIYR